MIPMPAPKTSVPNRTATPPEKASPRRVSGITSQANDTSGMSPTAGDPSPDHTGTTGANRRAPGNARSAGESTRTAFRRVDASLMVFRPAGRLPDRPALVAGAHHGLPVS